VLDTPQPLPDDHQVKAIEYKRVRAQPAGKSKFLRTVEMKIKLIVVLVFVTAIIAFSAIAATTASQNKGAANMNLNGGKRGNVAFPHHQHQEKLGDCNICHSIFPQKAGSIAELQADGKLQKKYVMNKLCTKCHKELKKAGKKSGPTTCTKCHVKE
jgi:hypothetical protein